MHERVDVRPDAEVAGTFARKVAVHHGVRGRYGIRRIREDVGFDVIERSLGRLERVEDDGGAENGRLA